MGPADAAFHGHRLRVFEGDRKRQSCFLLQPLLWYSDRVLLAQHSLHGRPNIRKGEGREFASFTRIKLPGSLEQTELARPNYIVIVRCVLESLSNEVQQFLMLKHELMRVNSGHCRVLLGGLEIR